jgi:hypothetical protein
MHHICPHQKTYARGRINHRCINSYSSETTMAAKNKVRGSVSNLEQATTSVNERILKVSQKRDHFNATF